MPSNPKKTAIIATSSTTKTNRKRRSQKPPSNASDKQARNATLHKDIANTQSDEYQRSAWNELRLSIRRLIFRLHIRNLEIIAQELFNINIIRGRGLLCTLIIQAQKASPELTNCYAAFVAIINSKFPEIGELLIKRLIHEFFSGIQRKLTVQTVAAARFLAHLTNQRICHKMLALEMLTYLVRGPTNCKIEAAIEFVSCCGRRLQTLSPTGLSSFYKHLERIRAIENLGGPIMDTIAMAFERRDNGFLVDVENETYEIVRREDQRTHIVTLDQELDAQFPLGVYGYGNIDVKLFGQ